MTESIYKWYATTKKLIADATKSISEDEGIRETIAEWENSISIMELACPDLMHRYEKRLAMHRSFTPEQIDFICYQIGEWYVDWKDRMATGEGICHRLGYAKEQLKTMICGD